MKAVLEFPSVRGIQAGREYYISMRPLGLAQKIFHVNESGLTPEQRSQRQLSKGRVPKVTRYLIENRNDCVFSALTASIDGNVVFIPNPGDDLTGTLRVEMKTSKIVINDEQHRRAAIETALEKAPELADTPEQRDDAAVDFWNRVAKQMPHWEDVRCGDIGCATQHLHQFTKRGSPRFVTCGQFFVEVDEKKKIEDPLPRLMSIGWRRSADIWVGRAVVAGRMSKTHQSVTLTSNVIETHLGLPLSADEQSLKDAFRRHAHAA